MNNGLLGHINEYVLNGKKVLILGGGSYQRSAAIIGAYLVKYNHFTPDYVEEYISGKINGIYSTSKNNFRETLNKIYLDVGGSP
jgi:protein-tyrosine phosphatase